LADGEAMPSRVSPSAIENMPRPDRYSVKILPTTGADTEGPAAVGRIPAVVVTRVGLGRQTSGCVDLAGDGRCAGAAVVSRSYS
jgi:hypothetical protein